MLRIILLIFSVFSASSFASIQIFPENRDPSNLFEMSYINDDYGSRISWNIPNENYIYRDKIQALDSEGNAIELRFPDGKIHNDEFFGETEIYRISLDIPILREDYGSVIRIKYQGCSDAGICYMPEDEEIIIGDQGNPAKSAIQDVFKSTNKYSAFTPLKHIESNDLLENQSIKNKITESEKNKSKTEARDGSTSKDESVAQRLEGSGLIINIIAFFSMGLLLSFTPCMLPMLPILASVVGGSKSGLSHKFRLGIAFIISMSLVYAVLGVIAARLGESLAPALQQAWLVIPFAMVFVVLAMAQFGFFTLQLPSFIRERLQGADRGIKGGGFIGASALGAISALLIGPCMTAPLAGALLYIAQSGDSVKGGLALFSLGIGGGLPLIIALTVGMKWLPKPGNWMKSINTLFGFALLAVAIFIAKSAVSNSIFLAMTGILLIAFGSRLSVIDEKSIKATARFFAILSILWGGAMLLGSTTQSSSFFNPLGGTINIGQEAQSEVRPKMLKDISKAKKSIDLASSSGQPIMLDFYADWCTSCKSMEKNVFSKDDVIKSLSEINVIKIDVTEGSSDQKKFMRDLGVMGPPTIIFINPEGEENRSLRISGAISKNQFMKKISEFEDSF